MRRPERGTTGRVRNVLYRPAGRSGPPARSPHDHGLWAGACALGGGRGRRSVAIPFTLLLLLVESAWEPLENLDRTVADNLNRRPAATAPWCTRSTSLAIALDPWVFRAAVARGGGLALAPRRQAAGRSGRP